MKWNETARKGYTALYAKMVIKPERMAEVDKICDRILAGRGRYRSVGLVPWWWIGIVHNLESGCDFKTYLGNGEPLNRATRLVPAGRGPFSTWEAGAVDALKLHNLHKELDWTIPHALYLFEAWNGWGYVGKDVNSPYIWSFSNLYSSGKYVSDGVWSASAVSAQCGAAVILKRLIDRKEVVMSVDLLKLVPLIERVAPVLATRLLGPGAGAAVAILARALDTDADPAAVAAKLETAPTSVATEKLLQAEAEAGGSASTNPPATNGTLVDSRAVQINTLVTSVLFAIALKMFGDASTAHTIADALAPIIMGGASTVAGIALNWVISRLVHSSNEATIKALS